MASYQLNLASMIVLAVMLLTTVVSATHEEENVSLMEERAEHEQILRMSNLNGGETCYSFHKLCASKTRSSTDSKCEQECEEQGHNGGGSCDFVRGECCCKGFASRSRAQSFSSRQNGMLMHSEEQPSFNDGRENQGHQGGRQNSLNTQVQENQRSPEQTGRRNSFSSHQSSHSDDDDYQHYWSRHFT